MVQLYYIKRNWYVCEKLDDCRNEINSVTSLHKKKLICMCIELKEIETRIWKTRENESELTHKGDAVIHLDDIPNSMVNKSFLLDNVYNDSCLW